MTEAFFEYNGVKSTDMYLRIENEIVFPSPEADIELVPVLGKDGELVVDNDRLKSVRFPIPVQLRLPEGVSVNEQATKISNWLKNSIGFSPLKFSGQPDFYYMALMYEQFDIRESLKNFGKTVLVFRLKPYKFKNDDDLQEVVSGQNLNNDTGRVADPYIKVTGSGDITLKNNGEDWLILYNVEDYIEIDSEVMSAYKDDLPQNNKMNSQLSPMFPVLDTGDNVITIEGNVTKLEIHARWEVIT